MNITQKVKERILQRHPDINILFVGYAGKSKSAWDGDTQHKFFVWREGRDLPILWRLDDVEFKRFNGLN